MVCIEIYVSFVSVERRVSNMPVSPFISLRNIRFIAIFNGDQFPQQLNIVLLKETPCTRVPRISDHLMSLLQIQSLLGQDVAWRQFCVIYSDVEQVLFVF